MEFGNYKQGAKYNRIEPVNGHRIFMDSFISTLQAKFRIFSVLEAGHSLHPHFNYFEYHEDWGESGSERMAAYKNGEGIEVFFLFSTAGVVAKVLNNDPLKDVDKLLKAVPDIFGSFKGELAFDLLIANCYIWRTRDDKAWSSAPMNADYTSNLEPLWETVEGFVRWMEIYHEVKLEKSAIEAAAQKLNVDLSALLEFRGT